MLARLAFASAVTTRLFSLLPAALAIQTLPAQSRPNVVIVMTDDQGCGDFGFAGNPVIRTPNLDRLAAGGARLERFYVHPVCTPTRAALMTGRWPQRTRAFDTYIGRAMLEPGEVTLAEALRAAGYRTGIFGKWHLGDCYPLRAIDQGFDEALVHRGGGIGQPSDPTGGEGKYTDAVLFQNGVRTETEGYCTDVYVDHALDFIDRAKAAGAPFFCYVPTNAPHGPFHDVPAEELGRYRGADLAAERFPQDVGWPIGEQIPAERLARIYAMIDNVDQNVGRLLARLEALDLLDKTLVLFLVDNGPNGRRYVRGFRGAKGDVFEGGIRSPLIAHWPGTIEPGRRAGPAAANVDVFDTVLDACGVEAPDGPPRDGRSFWPRLADPRAPRPDDERVLVIQAHRGDRLTRFHHVAVLSGPWKLVNPSGFGRELESVEPDWQLYHLGDDPFEQRDVAAGHPDVVRRLDAAYVAWCESVEATRERPFDPPRIVVGSDAESVTTLTRQDWRRLENGRWNGRMRGRWWLDVVDPGPWRVTVRFANDTAPRRVELVLGGWRRDCIVPRDARSVVFDRLALPTGPGELEVRTVDDRGTTGAYQVDLARIPGAR